MVQLRCRRGEGKRVIARIARPRAGRLTRPAPAAGVGRQGLRPCTPEGCVILAKRTLGSLEGANGWWSAARSWGPARRADVLAEGLHGDGAHSKTRAAGACSAGRLLVAAIGQPRMVRGDWTRPGATVIDVGINRVPAPEKGEGATRLVGDVDFDEAMAVAGAITPVPKGVGPMTIACLLRNTVKAACAREARTAGVLLRSRSGTSRRKAVGRQKGADHAQAHGQQQHRPRGRQYGHRAQHYGQLQEDLGEVEVVVLAPTPARGRPRRCAPGRELLLALAAQRVAGGRWGRVRRRSGRWCARSRRFGTSTAARSAALMSGAASWTRMSPRQS